MELEDKNLVKHLDQEGQQWTRVIIAAQEEDTHSELIFKSSFCSHMLFQRLFSINPFRNYPIHFVQPLQ